MTRSWNSEMLVIECNTQEKWTQLCGNFFTAIKGFRQLNSIKTLTQESNISNSMDKANQLICQLVGQVFQVIRGICHELTYAEILYNTCGLEKRFCETMSLRQLRRLEEKGSLLEQIKTQLRLFCLHVTIGATDMGFAAKQELIVRASSIGDSFSVLLRETSSFDYLEKDAYGSYSDAYKKLILKMLGDIETYSIMSRLELTQI